MHSLTKILIGTSGWSYADWQGVFYPAGYSKLSWLQYYATKFSTVEINATFYHLFNEKTYFKWYEQVPKDFCFVIKVPRLISHRKYLSRCEEDIKRFCETAANLHEKLSLYLLQLPAKFPFDLTRLEKGIMSFRDPKQVVVEFRHPKWYRPDVKAVLEKLGCVFCAVDSPASTLIDWVTSEVAYIRLHGRAQWFNYDYSNKELYEIAEFICHIAGHGAKVIYVFFNNDMGANAPKNALQLKKILSKMNF